MLVVSSINNVLLLKDNIAIYDNKIKMSKGDNNKIKG